MNKGILIKGSIIMGFFLLIIGAAVGCSLITGDATEPKLSNGDNVYFTMDDFTVTDSQLWEVMRNVDGLSYLEDYVDHILLEDEINNVTQEEVDKEIKYAKYLTYSDEKIAEIQEDAELNQDYIDAFEQNLVILGFDPSNPDDLRTYTEVGIAKTNIAKQYMLDASGDDVYALQEQDMKDYYESMTYGDVCGLEIRFQSAPEANSVFDEFNLVPNFNLGIGEYIDENIAIEDVASDGFLLDKNTVQLTEEEIFSKFVLIYNYMNPWETPIPEDITQENYCNDFADVAKYNFDDMVYDRESTDPYVGLAAYIFNTLSVDPEDEAALRYSTKSQAIGEGFVYFFKENKENAVAFEDLSSTELDEVKDEILDLVITTEVIDEIISTIYEDTKLEIYDPYLALKHYFDGGEKFDNDGSSNLVAKIGDIEITADELFAFMEERVGAFYTIELAKIDMLLTSDAYFDLYGDDYDYLNSKNDAMVANRDELRTMKSNFAGNAYVDYGFSSAEYTWEEFMYLAFGVKTESEVIEQLYIMQDLQATLVFPTLDYDNVEDYIAATAEEYFSLNAQHVLIYVDYDKDFTPDNFTDYIDGLTPSELVEYQAIKVAFDSLIFSKIDDGMTFAEITVEYKNSLMNDPLNEWKQFKQYGFKIMTENLTPPDDSGNVTSLDNTTAKSFDLDFATALKRIYDVYVIEEANSITPITEYLDTQITESAFGIHLILATEGTGFEQYSAKYDPSNTTDTGTFTDGSENDSDIPNESQIEIYNRRKFAALGGELTTDLLPTTVYNSVDLYYGEIFDAYFTQTGFSIVTLNYMLANNAEFTIDNTTNLETLQDILDVLYIVNFPEGFVVVD
jgi:hypothetical protein